MNKKSIYNELEEWFYPIEPIGIIVFVITTIVLLGITILFEL